MNLRLQVTAAGKTTSFEHAGPVVHAGRDPSCELTFDGEASTGVSRRHARIELAPGGATLADAGSSNGTLHNDRPIAGAVPLRVGDRIQLGYTGPKLTVLALDLAPARAPTPAATAAPAVAPLPEPAARPPVVLIGAGAAAGAVLVAVVLVWLLHRPPATTEPTAAEVAAASASAGPATVPATTRREPPPTEREPAVTARARPPAETQPPAADAGSLELTEQPVGRHIAPPEWGPSVLLARRGEAYPWAPVAADEKVLSAQPLLSLPGYRSEILLDRKVQVTLWGNVPEFDGITPLLLESSAMLRAPEKGVDLDLTLEWGRVKIANRKEKGPAQVRLRFRGQVWDLTLPDGASEVVAELLAASPPRSSARDRPAIPQFLDLFTKGPATLRVQGPKPEQLDLPDRTRVTWSSVPGAPLFRKPMPELPAWWVKPPDPKNDRVADVMISLKDWTEPLNGRGELVQTILDAVGKSRDPGFLEQAMYFLEPLDGAQYLVNYLEFPDNDRVRRAAAHALRAWLTREPGNLAELARLLQGRVNSPTKAARILELMQPYAKADLKKPETYQKLIQDLKDDSIAVRELALWQLTSMAPDVARKVTYDPSGPAKQRQQVVAELQKLLPPGSLPRSASP